MQLQPVTMGPIFHLHNASLNPASLNTVSLNTVSLTTASLRSIARAILSQTTHLDLPQICSKVALMLVWLIPLLLSRACLSNTSPKEDSLSQHQLSHATHLINRQQRRHPRRRGWVSLESTSHSQVCCRRTFLSHRAESSHQHLLKYLRALG